MNKALNLRKQVKFFILYALIAPAVSFAQQDKEVCPILEVGTVYETIQNESYWSAFWDTLTSVTLIPPDEIVKREPTANPYDTFYNMWSVRKIGGTRYLIMTSNFLAKNIQEARNRATKIIFSNTDWKSGFIGQLDEKSHACIYKDFQASPSIPNYPFKSAHEHIRLTATDMDYAMPGGNGG